MRPNWDQYFLGLSYLVAERSHDPHTHHGAIIVSKDNRILGTGYNSYMKGIKDYEMPKNRPAEQKQSLVSKYDFMIHAEENAILNCSVNLQDVSDVKIYITGPPCANCLQRLHQVGIKEIIHGSRGSHMFLDDKEITKQKIVLSQSHPFIRCFLQTTEDGPKAKLNKEFSAYKELMIESGYPLEWIKDFGRSLIEINQTI